MINLLDWLNSVRENLLFIADRCLPPTHAGLLAGIVLGTRVKMDNDFYQALVSTGTMHVVAASGFNINVVAKSLFQITSVLFPRKLAISFSFMGIIFYTFLAGATEPVVRAAIMGGLAFGAQALGREYEAKRALIVSAVLMLAFSPSLISNVSFQLSVAATAGILWLEPILSRRIEKAFLLLAACARSAKDFLFKNGQGIEETLRSTISPDQMVGVSAASRRDPADLRVPPSRSSFVDSKKTILNNSWFDGVVSGLKTNLSTTLAATIAVLPITLITFERISIISPVVNVLVLWLVPPLMFLGGLLMLVGLVWLPLAQIVGVVTYPLLAVFIAVVKWFGILPGASLQFSGLTWLFGGGWYLLLAAWVASGRKNHISASDQG